MSHFPSDLTPTDSVKGFLDTRAHSLYTPKKPSLSSASGLAETTTPTPHGGVEEKTNMSPLDLCNDRARHPRAGRPCLGLGPAGLWDFPCDSLIGWAVGPQPEVDSSTWVQNVFAVEELIPLFISF